MSSKECGNCKLEFGCTRRNWCCMMDQPLLFGVSQWRCGPTWLFLALHRVPWALFWFAYGIYDIYMGIDDDFYAERFTQWQLFLVILNSVVGMIVAAIMQAGHLREKWHPFLGFYWVLYNTTLVLSLTLDIVFWALFRDALGANYDSYGFISVTVHAVTGIYTLYDFWLCAVPLRAYHWYPAGALTIFYFCFYAIYEATTGKLPYSIFSFFSRPGMSIGLVIAALVAGIALWYFLYGMYKLRSFISRLDCCEKCRYEGNETELEDLEMECV